MSDIGIYIIVLLVSILRTALRGTLLEATVATPPATTAVVVN